MNEKIYILSELIDCISKKYNIGKYDEPKGPICILPDNGYDESLLIGSAESYAKLIINLATILDAHERNDFSAFTDIEDIEEIQAVGLFPDSDQKNKLRNVDLKYITVSDELFRGSPVVIKGYAITELRTNVEAIVRKINYDIDPLLRY